MQLLLSYRCIDSRLVHCFNFSHSLGATLVYLLTGKHPADLPQKNLRLQFEKFTNLSPGFSYWLKQMIEPSLDKRFSSAKDALEAVRNPQTIENLVVNKKKVIKPANSQIKYYQYEDSIEIQYPQLLIKILPKLRIKSLTVGVFLFFFCLLFATSLAPLLFSLFLFHPFLRLFKDPLLETLSRHIKCYEFLLIDRNKKIQVGNSLGNKKQIKWKPKIDLKTINLLAYYPGYSFNEFFDETGKRLSRGKVEIQPKLSIYMDNHEHSIGTDILSPGELYWLGQELSNFLNLELQIIHQTPRVPPEPRKS